MQKMLKTVCFMCCVDSAETCFHIDLLKYINVLVYMIIIYVLNAINCIFRASCLKFVRD